LRFIEISEIVHAPSPKFHKPHIQETHARLHLAAVEHTRTLHARSFPACCRRRRRPSSVRCRRRHARPVFVTDARLNADETPPSNTSPPSSNPTSRLHLAAGQQFINSSLSL